MLMWQLDAASKLDLFWVWQILLGMLIYDSEKNNEKKHESRQDVDLTTVEAKYLREKW